MLLTTLPQSYIDLKKTSESERRAWDRAVAVLQQRKLERGTSDVDVPFILFDIGLN